MNFLNSLFQLTIPSETEVTKKVWKIFSKEHIKSMAGGEIDHTISTMFPFKYENKWYFWKKVQITYLVNEDGTLKEMIRKII